MGGWVRLFVERKPSPRFNLLRTNSDLIGSFVMQTLTLMLARLIIDNHSQTCATMCVHIDAHVYTDILYLHLHISFLFTYINIPTNIDLCIYIYIYMYLYTYVTLEDVL